MALKQEEIIKKNLAFIYGRPKGQEIFDPDKHVVIKGLKSSRENAEFFGKDINSFTEEYEFLAPSYPCNVVLGKDFTSPYPSYEHALIASKLNKHPNRESLCATIKTMDNIREVKKFVNKNIDDNSWWKEKCGEIAEILLRDKFFRSKELRSKLINTEKRNLIFGNGYNEMIWGVHLPTGKGDNLLGKLLMKIREEIDKGMDLIRWVKYSIVGEEPLDGIANSSISVLVTENDQIMEDECKIIKSTSVNSFGVFIVTIGKHSSNDLVNQHESINSSHGIIAVISTHTKNSISLVYIDLESVNKSRIDGKVCLPYQPIAITKESILTIGTSIKKYRFDYSLDIEPSSSSSSGKEDIYNRMLASGAVGEVIEKSRMESTIYVGNIPYDMTEQGLRGLFASCGEIASNGLEYPKDRVTGKPKGFALITFVNSNSVTKSLFRDGDDVNGRKIRVKRAEKINDTSQSSQSSRDRDREDIRVGEKRGYSMDDRDRSYGLTKRSNHGS